jgi:hypothetical protein
MLVALKHKLLYWPRKILTPLPSINYQIGVEAAQETRPFLGGKCADIVRILY